MFLRSFGADDRTRRDGYLHQRWNGFLVDLVRRTTFGQDSLCRTWKSDIPASLYGKHVKVPQGMLAFGRRRFRRDGDHVLACKAQWTSEESVARVALQS